MKKLLAYGLGVVGLVILGFGCRANEPVTTPTASDGTSLRPTETISGAWFLAFDLPKDWVMVAQYEEDAKIAPTADQVTNQMSDIVVQSTDAIIDLDGEKVVEGAVTDGYAYMRVFRMDKRTGVPAEAEDIGDGFYKLAKGVTLTYYFKGASANYKFVVYWDEVDEETIEDVVTSAKEVNDFLEAGGVRVETEE